MKTFFLGSVALILTTGLAAAADMPARTPYAKAPAMIAYDWSGFYLGGYWGTSIGQSRASTPGNVFTGTVDISQKGWTAGGTVGVNWQFNPNWLIGVEGDLGFLDSKRSFTDWNDSAVTAGVKTSWYGTARARLGYVTGPSLLYVTGGAAFVRLEDTFGGCVPAVCAQGSAPISVTSTKTGWTAGGGIETKLSRNWSQKTEYLYVDAGSTDFAANPVNVAQTASFRNQFHVIKTGINYKFGGPAEALPFFSDAMLPTNHDWAGFYAGVNAGGGLTTSRAPGGPALATVVTNNDMRGNGFAGGAQVGYNLMNLFGRPALFAGVEGDIGYLGVKASHDDWNDFFRMNQKTDWYGTLRGRIGTTTGPALLYATGGVAFVQVENGISTTLTPAQQAQIGVTLTNDVRSDTRAGWTFGGGTQVALDAHWSAKLEYLYIDAGKSQRAVRLSQPGFATSFNSDVSNRFHVIRAGLNYSLNAPVVAKC